MNNMPGVHTKQYDDFQVTINGVSVICSVIQLSILVHCFHDFKLCKGAVALDGKAIDVDIPLIPDGLTDTDTIQDRIKAKSKSTIAQAQTKGASHAIPGIQLKSRLMEERFCPSLEAFNNEVKDLPYNTKTIRFLLPASVDYGISNKYFNGGSKDPKYLEKEIMVVKKDNWPYYFASFFVVVNGSERVVKDKKPASVEVDLEDATAGLDGMFV